jgi:hypothetical protein
LEGHDVAKEDAGDIENEDISKKKTENAKKGTRKLKERRPYCRVKMAEGRRGRERGESSAWRGRRGRG